MADRENDLAGRIARPILFLVKLLAWDGEAWRKMSPNGTSWAPPPKYRPGGKPQPPPRPPRPPSWKNPSERAYVHTDGSPGEELLGELLDIYHQVSPQMRKQSGIHWVLTPEAYDKIRKLRDGDGNYFMSHNGLKDPLLLGWPARVSCEALEPWSLHGRWGGEVSIEEPNPLREEIRLG